jgi:hypothetical protein
VNIGWDSAGVTTGPVTVPLVLAMGLGFGGAVNAVEGFGILAAASIAPICAVLGARRLCPVQGQTRIGRCTGLINSHRINRIEKGETNGKA